MIRSVIENAQYREVNETRKQGKKRQGCTGEYLRNEEKRWKRLEVLFLLSRCVGRIIRTQADDNGAAGGRGREGKGKDRERARREEEAQNKMRSHYMHS